MAKKEKYRKKKKLTTVISKEITTIPIILWVDGPGLSDPQLS